MLVNLCTVQVKMLVETSSKLADPKYLEKATFYSIFFFVLMLTFKVPIKTEKHSAF